MNPDGPAIGTREQRRALALLAVTLVLSMTTWFSASAVIPQLRTEWRLPEGSAAWLTIAVQLGFVCGALVSSLLNLSDIVSPRHVILGGAMGAAAANALLPAAGGGAIGIPLRFRRRSGLRAERADEGTDGQPWAHSDCPTRSRRGKDL